MSWHSHLVLLLEQSVYALITTQKNISYKVISHEYINVTFLDRNLTKEIEIQQAKIEELVAKRIWDEAGSREEEQHLSEELQRARQGILEQENERMRTQVENESLMLKLAELETELAKKAELVVELQLKLEKLKVENENITEGAKMMIESQRQLNAHLTEVCIF